MSPREAVPQICFLPDVHPHVHTDILSQATIQKPTVQFVAPGSPQTESHWLLGAYVPSSSQDPLLVGSLSFSILNPECFGLCGSKRLGKWREGPDPAVSILDSVYPQSWSTVATMLTFLLWDRDILEKSVCLLQ